MGSRFLIAICFVLLVGTWVSDTRAGEDDSFRRWGIGWDKGIALRYRPDPAWGLGVQVNPNLFNSDEFDPDGDGDRERFEERDNFRISFGFLAYREWELGRWVRLGPYSAVSFAYDESDDTTDQFDPDRTRHWFDTRHTRELRVEIGFRPAFAIEDRFVLESRFGFVLTRETRDSDRRYVDDRNGVVTETVDLEDSQTWRFSAFGTNLGLGSVLQFIIYL